MRGYPTILVAGIGYSQLIEGLRRDGYHVLEAAEWDDVLRTITLHSRPIHLLVGDESMENRAPLLQKHRPWLLFFFASSPVDVGASLARIKQLVVPPP